MYNTAVHSLHIRLDPLPLQYALMPLARGQIGRLKRLSGSPIVIIY